MSLLSLTPAGAACGAWYDAYDRSTITLDGTRVTAVADKSGNSVALSNAEGTDTRHPTYSESEGALVFTHDAGQYLRHDTFDPDYDEVRFFFSYTSLGDGDYFLTVSQDNNSSTGDFSLRLSGSGPSTGNVKYYIGRSTAMNENLDGVWDTGLKRVATVNHANATDLSRFRLVGHSSTTTTAVTEHDKTLRTISSGERSLAGSVGQAGLFIGGDFGSSPWPDSVDVNIHEVAIYNKYMTEAEAAPIEEYLLNHGPPKAPTQSPPSTGRGIRARR